MSVDYGERNAMVDTFTSYAFDRAERLANLSGLIGDAMPVLEHFDEPGGTNNMLVEAGRTDLVIVDPASMMSVTTPQEIAKKCNNFTPNFLMPTGERETGEADIHDNPKMELVPPVVEDVLALRDIPKDGDCDELEGSYKAFNFMSHARKPAFIRMLNLWPDFTADLVTRISAPEERYRYDRFEAELFVAYQLMVRLVDQSDHGVMRDDEVDDWYLCR